MKIAYYELKDNHVKLTYRDIESSTQSMRELVGGLLDCLELAYFTINNVTYAVDLMCHEEGRLLNLPPTLHYQYDFDYPGDVIAGNCIVVLHNNITGKFEDLPEWIFNLLKQRYYECNFNVYGTINPFYRLPHINIDSFCLGVQNHVKSING